MDRERVGSTTVAASGWMTGFKLLIAVTVVIGVLAPPAAGSARSTGAQAREALIRAQLTPRPLYPSILPDPLGIDNTATFTHGHFFRWKGSNTNPDWFSINYKCRCYGRRSDLVNATFSRSPVSDVGKAINLSQNVQGHPVSRVRVHGRRMYRFKTDRWFGYMWKQQGFAYSVFARYSSRVGWTFMREFVGSLHPLGRLWTGRTSQGRPVYLYRSGGGLDWTVFFVFSCAGGGRTDVGYDEDLVGVNHGGAFADVFSLINLPDPDTPVRDTLSMKGRFPSSTGTKVTGSFDSHQVSVHHPGDPRWNCGAKLSWQASPFSE